MVEYFPGSEEWSNASSLLELGLENSSIPSPPIPDFPFLPFLGEFFYD